MSSKREAEVLLPDLGFSCTNLIQCLIIVDPFGWATLSFFNKNLGIPG